MRLILIPGHNLSEADIRLAGEQLRGLRTLTAVKLLAYQSLTRSKFAALGLPNTMPRVPSPDEPALRRVAGRLQKLLPPGLPVRY